MKGVLHRMEDDIAGNLGIAWTVAFLRLGALRPVAQGLDVSADRILLGFMACWMLIELFKHEMVKRQCAYCGEVNAHRQDCPMDHLGQNDKGGT